MKKVGDLGNVRFLKKPPKTWPKEEERCKEDELGAYGLYNHVEMFTTGSCPLYKPIVVHEKKDDLGASDKKEDGNSGEDADGKEAGPSSSWAFFLLFSPHDQAPRSSVGDSSARRSTRRRRKGRARRERRRRRKGRKRRRHRGARRRTRRRKTRSRTKRTRETRTRRRRRAPRGRQPRRTRCQSSPPREQPGEGRSP